MRNTWKTVLAFSSLVLHSEAKQIPIGTDPRIAVMNAGMVGISVYRSSNGTMIDVPDGPANRLHRSINLNEIVPAADAAGNERCCPIGTINDGTGCVFPNSSVCPKGTRLEGNNCISEKPPQCPEGLVYNGRNCIGQGPSCPLGSRFNGEACESETTPVCRPGFEFRDGSCAAQVKAGCSPGFILKNRLCTSSTGPQCPLGLKFEDGSCVGSKYIYTFI